MKDKQKGYRFRIRPSVYKLMRDVYCKEDLSWEEVLKKVFENYVERPDK